MFPFTSAHGAPVHLLGRFHAVGALCLLAAWQPRAVAQDAATSEFDVMEFRVLGNSVLEGPDIERVVYPFLGEHKTIKDIDAARAALEGAYHDRGYGTVFVDIPEQNVEGGIVRLKITEGTLAHARVAGARYFSGREIRAALPAATVGTVPHLPSLQAEITALNTQTSDRAVVPVLKAGASPGTVDLTLKVDDHLPFHGDMEVNNQYTADTTHLRVVGVARYDNLFGRMDSLSLQYQTAPQARSEVGVLAAGYTAALNDHGRKLSIYYVDSNSDVATIGALSVLGKGHVYGMRLLQPLALTVAGSHSLSVGLDYKDFEENLQVDPKSSLRTPISYLNLVAAYTGSWRSAKQQFGLNTSLTFGARGLANSADEFENKRFKAQPNYSYLRTDASYGVRLPADFNLLLRAGGQYGVDPLVSNEQFSISGADGVRGYLEAEELGDIGVKGTAQIGSPQLALLSKRIRLDAFVFYDAGRISVTDPLPGQDSNSALRSWGAGIDLYAFDHVSGSLTWAYPLLSASRTERGDSRLLFSVRGLW